MIENIDSLEQLTEDEVVELVLDEHPEVRVLWQRRDTIIGPVEINGANPVLHVLLESIVEQQVRNDDPVEARLALERLQGLGLTRHAARTVISSLFDNYIYDAWKNYTTFDRDDYAKALNLLGSMVKKVGRNEPCPCGSGKKFKRCCIDRFSKVKPLQMLISSPGGVDEKLILGSGNYATQGYLESASHDDPLLVLENRAHIADFLEQHGDLEGAWLALQQNIELAVELGRDGLINNAYLDALMLCENNPELADKGVALINDFIKYCEDEDEKLQLRCDKADLLASQGKFDAAEEEYQALFEEHPEWHFAKYRYALLLYNVDRDEEALQILRQLKSLEVKLDRFTLDAVNGVLDEFTRRAT